MTKKYLVFTGPDAVKDSVEWEKSVAQSKRSSVIETVTGTAVGYAVAVVSQTIIFPFYDIELPLETNMVVAAWFTLVSLVRGYWVRRIFNFLHVKGVLG